RAGENAREPGSNAGVEVAFRVARLLVELHRRRDVLGVHRPAICAAREVGENPLRTGRFIRGRSRPADEHLVAARGRADAFHVVRSFDSDGLETREPANHVDFLAVALRGLPDVLALSRPLAPGEANVVRAGGD